MMYRQYTNCNSSVFRMESFFLSETTKYLYLLFDPDNFIHNDGETAKIVETTVGKCVIEGIIIIVYARIL